MNDAWVYKTRVKAFTNNVSMSKLPHCIVAEAKASQYSQPIFSAGTERFIPDYTKATVILPFSFLIGISH